MPAPHHGPHRRAQARGRSGRPTAGYAEGPWACPAARARWVGGTLALGEIPAGRTLIAERGCRRPDRTLFLHPRLRRPPEVELETKTRSWLLRHERRLVRAADHRPRRDAGRHRHRAPCARRWRGSGSTRRGSSHVGERARVVAVLAKRRKRPGLGSYPRAAAHKMLDDSDVSATRQRPRFRGRRRSGALFGETELFVSGGAEHQGPDGGRPPAPSSRTAHPHPEAPHDDHDRRPRSR